MLEAIKKIPSRKRRKIELFCLAMVFILFVIAFSYVPILGWAIAFLKYRPGLPLFSQQFVGLNNFRLLFSSWPDIKMVLTNTLA